MIVDIFAGTLGGIAVVFVGHPFDTTKTRLQTAPLGYYRGTLDCVQKTISSEGLKGFYAGMFSPLGGQMIFRATSFTTFYQSLGMQTSGCPSVSQLFTSGALTGFIISFVETPIDLLKTRLQTQIFQGRASPVPYRTVCQCARYILQNHGPRVFWQGLSGTIARNVPANALFFSVAESVKHYLPSAESFHMSLARSLVAGACAGLSYWVTTYPLDVIKAKMQSAELGSKPSWGRTALGLYRDAGWSAFARGFPPCAARAVPACASMYTTVDLVRSFFDQSCCLPH